MQLGGVEGGGIWTHGGLEGTPIAENGFLYVTDGWGSVYKIDTHGGKGSCSGRWTRRPTMTGPARSPAAASTTAASALCGQPGDLPHARRPPDRHQQGDRQVEWQRQVANPDKGEVVTGAPLVVKNMAITGVAGAEYGIRGWIAATDLKTQKEVWRTYTIPAKGEPGSETWKGDNDAAANGGGSTWVTGTYDPATNTHLSGASAIRARTGTTRTVPATTSTPTARWRSTPTPARSSGTSSTRRTTPTTTTASRRTCWSTLPNGKKLALEADRNGFAYAVDRSNGQFVWGLPFVKKVTWTKGIDPEDRQAGGIRSDKGVQTYTRQGATARTRSR